jgi:ABC-type nitrate/sulfonate/bicarbonate transport system permease component
MEGGMTAQTSAFVPRRDRWYERHFRLVVGVVAVLALAGAWQACAALHLVDPNFTSSPSGVAVAEFDYFVHSTGLRDIRTTGTEFGVGLGLSIAIGVPLGLMMGYYRVVNALCEPIINLLYATPFIALAPLFVVWFGVGILSKLAVILLAIVPIAMATAGGVQTVEGSLLNVARVYRASDVQIFRTLILPGTVPSVIAGIRLGTGFALIGAITAEFIASTSGVGYSINYDGYSELTAPLFAGVVLVSMAGLFFGSLVRVLERRVDRWRVV